MKKEWKALKEPNIIHFCESSFPCWKRRMFDNYYWKYAWGSTFYNSLIKKRIAKIQELSKDENQTMSTNKREEDDFFLQIKTNGKVEKKQNILLLHAGGCIFGPNISLGKGKHVLIIESKMDKYISCKVKLVAGARHILLVENEFGSGQQKISFECTHNQIDVEILIENETSNDICIEHLSLQ